MRRFYILVKAYPSVVLGIIALICASTTYISLTRKQLPSFEDPQLGFETRGTEIARRTIAWDNLMEESKPRGSLVLDPSELISKLGKRDLRESSSQLHSDSVIPARENSHEMEEEGEDDEEDEAEEEDGEAEYNELNKRDLRKSSSQLHSDSVIPARENSHKIVEEDDEDDDEFSDEDDESNDDGKRNRRNEDRERWSRVKQLAYSEQDNQDNQDESLESSSRTNYGSNFFCDEVQPGYAQIVFSAKRNHTLFSVEAIKDLCRYQIFLESLPNYMRLCVTSVSGSCCNMWSLPNYIIWLHKLSHCGQITNKVVESTLSLLKTCRKFYREGKLSAQYRGTDVPRECAQNNDVYNIMQYIVDVDFLSQDNSTYLRDTSIYLPVAKSSTTLKLFHDIENVVHKSNYNRISAMDLGVKYSLFDEYLVQDIRYLLLSVLFIIICAWAYTGCIFITVLTISAIFFSLVNAYFIYTFIFSLEFFPFMNILAVIVSLGIGSDDAYIICKVWDQMKKENAHASKTEIVYLVAKHSAFAVFVTTLTTVAAFLSSYWSSVTAVKCFSIFAGLSTFLNFVFMLTWILSGIVVSSEWPYIPGLHWGFTPNSDNFMKKLLNVKSSFDQCIIHCIEKYNLVLIVVFSCISAISVFAVLIWPRLQVPDSSEFQLFERKHVFEQYDLVYRERFRFSQSYGEQNYEEKIPLRFVWGISPSDSGNNLDPTSRGKLHFDSTFDVASLESQEWLLKFCRRLRAQPFYKVIPGPALSNCFIETFKTWMNRKCIDPVDNTNRSPCCEDVKFPYPRKVFNVCVPQAMKSIYSVDTFLTSEVAGPRYLKNSTRKNPKMKALVVEFSSNMSYTTSFEAMNTFYQQVETWTKNELSNAPPGMKNGWFISYVSFFDLQRYLVQDTTCSILTSMFIALLVLFFVTFNVPLSLIAILTITCIIFVSVSVLIVFGWKLNILESIAISLAIGMSVDFSLHYAVTYKLSHDKTNRRTSVVHALSMVVSPSFMAAITTGASGLFMLPSIVLPYIQIGVFLIVVSSVSWIFATFFQMPLLYRYGPENDFGQFSYPVMDSSLLRKIKERFFKRRNTDANGNKVYISLFRPCEPPPEYSAYEMENLDQGKTMEMVEPKRLRCASFRHAITAVADELKPTKRLSSSLELIPSNFSPEIFLKNLECDRNGSTPKAEYV